MSTRVRLGQFMFSFSGVREEDCECLFAALMREAHYPLHAKEIWARRRRVVLFFEPNCPCGQKAWEVDHITPRGEGGSDAWGNLQALCTTCHDAKTKIDIARMRGAA